MDLGRLRGEDGFIRDAVKYVGLFVVILVLILDTIAVIQAQTAVRTTADRAAREALTSYVETGNKTAAGEVAKNYVESRDAVYLSATIDSGRSRNDAAATVSAQRKAKTYVFHYFSHMPWGLGEKVENMLAPAVTRTTRETSP